VRRVLITGMSLTAFLVAPHSQAVTADTGLGIRIVDAPVSRQDDPRARVYIVDNVAPGTTISRRLEVSNDNAQAQHVQLYPDAAVIADGVFSPAPQRTVSELTTWTSVEPSQLDLAPKAKALVRVSIVVPKDASPGERYAVLFAEAPAAPGRGLLLASRVGIRTYLSVSAGGEPASDFTIDSLTAARDATGTPLVRAQVHNTGGRALDMSGSLSLTEGPGSLKAGPFPAQLGSTLKPGDTEPVTVKLDSALPAGPWKARLELASGLLKRAATATIAFPKGFSSVAGPVKAQSVSLAKDRKVLLPIAGALVLGVGGVAGALLWRGRSQARRRVRST
jgi:hypothetical protein